LTPILTGDSCADHNIAWKVRHLLELDYVPSGVDPVVIPGKPNDDNIVYDIDPKTGKSASGWGHPECPGKTKENSSRLARAISHPTTLRFGATGACA
jgi:hypothetical protein